MNDPENSRSVEQTKLTIRIDEQTPMYERTTDIPQTPLRYIFNSGHVKNQLNPYLIELVLNHGAVPYKIKNESRAGYQVYVGIEPAKLFEWYATKINDPDHQNSWLNLRLALLESLGKSFTAKIREKLILKQIDPVAARNILFGMRQQLGQYFSLDVQIDFIEEQIKADLLEAANKRVQRTEQNIAYLQTQFTAAGVFLSMLDDYVARPENTRIFSGVPKLVFELSVAHDMYESARANLQDEAVSRARLEELATQIAEAMGSANQE